MGPFRFAFVAARLSCALLAGPLAVSAICPAQAQIFGAITIAPPVLPIYVQPPLPGPGYIWTPGFWSYDAEAGYYWVPGTWVQPPAAGLLWTPGYWAFDNGRYVFNRGYWGPHVGYYGGIHYGFGYDGSGFEGGEWRGGVFAYNRAANNLGNVHLAEIYDRRLSPIPATARYSFNGPNGSAARLSPGDAAFAREQHVQPTGSQQQHEREAAQTPGLRAAVNRGTPVIAATARPAEFRGAGVIPARPGPMAGLGASSGMTGRQPADGAARPAPTAQGGMPRQARLPADRPEMRAPMPVLHGPALPTERFNVTRPSTAAQPHAPAAPRQPAEGERHP